MTNRKQKRNENDWTSIPLMKETVKRLKKFPHKGDTYDTIIQRLLNEHEGKKK